MPKPRENYAFFIWWARILYVVGLARCLVLIHPVTLARTLWADRVVSRNGLGSLHSWLDYILASCAIAFANSVSPLWLEMPIVTDDGDILNTLFPVIVSKALRLALTWQWWDDRIVVSGLTERPADGSPFPSPDFYNTQKYIGTLLIYILEPANIPIRFRRIRPSDRPSKKTQLHLNLVLKRLSFRGCDAAYAPLTISFPWLLSNACFVPPTSIRANKLDLCIPDSEHLLIAAPILSEVRWRVI